MPSVALIALEKELDGVLNSTLKLVWKIMHKQKGPRKDASVWRKITFQPKNLLRDYQQLKDLEEELFQFALSLQEKNLSTEEASRLSELTHTLRLLVVGAKEFKDIVHNLKEMEDATEPFVGKVLADLQEEVKDFLTVFEEYHEVEKRDSLVLQTVEKKLKSNYSALIDSLYSHLRNQKTDVSISTLANVIQQVFSGLGLIWEGIGSMQKELPAPFDFPIPGSKWLSDSLVIPNKLPFSKNFLASGLDYSRRRSEVKIMASNIPEEYNTPIIDIPKGFSSKLPIKKFSEDFPSNMPILGKRPVLPEMRLENYNEDMNPKFLFDGDKP